MCPHKDKKDKKKKCMDISTKATSAGQDVLLSKLQQPNLRVYRTVFD